jgi:proteasome accessory factor B
MSTQSNTSTKTERLLNLVICLLYTRQPLSKAKIRDAVPQYGTTASTKPSTGCSNATRTSCASLASRW